MNYNTFERINDYHYRIGNRSIYTDFIESSAGIIRIGSMPDISKLTRKYKIEESIVILPDWYCSQGGDNWTGEEFNFWCYAYNLKKPPIYIGKEKNINLLYHNLDMIYSYNFDDLRLKVIKTDWLNRYFHSKIAKNNKVKIDSVEINFEKNTTTIIDGGKIIYNSLPDFDDSFIEDSIASLKYKKEEKSSIVDIEITVVGSGNGITGTTSSFVLPLGKSRIWIDPAAQPFYVLKNSGINWDDISHILITHNHEDHISGFTACVKRAILKNKVLNIITAKSIYKILIEQYKNLFPSIEKHIRLIELEPQSPLNIEGYTIEARWNHHILPYGTLGLKIKGNNTCIGISGDTKYDEEIVKKLKRSELEPEWFKECNLIFHEVDFLSTNSVHTYYRELEKLIKRVKGRLLVYHTDPATVKPGFILAEQGKRYILFNDSSIKIEPSVH